MSVDIGASEAKSEPNVVPLCDILLVLLIIFMVITPVAQKGIDIQLPDPGGAEQQRRTDQIVLVLEKDLTVKINQDEVAPEALMGRLRDLFQIRQNKTIFIKADNSVPYSEVLKIIDIAKGAGIEVLGVYTQKYETESST
jgi:biopolymer transport protein TolR